MTDGVAIATLLSEIAKSREVLARIEIYYVDYTRDWSEAVPDTREARIILAEIIANYYTCLETIFLRVSQFFENELAADRWHAHLLDKMMLDIPGVRPRVLSEESHAALRELMRFRHFKRYYLEFDYDTDKLVFLRKKLDACRKTVSADLDEFVAILAGPPASPNEARIATREIEAGKARKLWP